MNQRVTELQEKAQAFKAVLFEMTQDELEESAAQLLILIGRVMENRLDDAIQLYGNGHKEEAVQIVRDRLAELDDRKGGVCV